MDAQVLKLKEKIQASRAQLLAHKVYTQINDIKGLQKFAEFHVFAVWDFMSLLKSLQIGLTSVEIPWVPKGSANTRFLINEIVLGEESDVDEQNTRISHFELYLQAMRQMGAPTLHIDSLLADMKAGKDIQTAINHSTLPIEVKRFLEFTFDIVHNAPMHVKAAVFTFGREDLIPDMFTQILNEVHSNHPDKVSIFKYYIERHIEVDGGHHSHLALEMVKELCGEDQSKWEAATNASIKALETRSLLWDAILNN